MLKFLFRTLCGFFIGISTLAPGISGSIVALIVGIYHDLIDILSNPFKNIKKSITFLVPVLLGVAISIVTFVVVFSYVFKTYEKTAYLLFVGLVAGSLPMAIMKLKDCGFRKRYVFFTLSALIITLIVGLLGFSEGSALSAEFVAAGVPFFAISGFIGGSVLLVPGISLSIILILLGIYGQLIFAAESLLHINMTHLPHLIVFFVSIVAGLALTSKLIKSAFDKYPGAANSSVLGLMLGSLLVLLIQGLEVSDPGFALWHGITALILGLGVSAIFIIPLLKTSKKSPPE